MFFHLDLDAFYVAAEQIKDRALKGKPIAIGGRSDPFIFSKTPSNRNIEFQNSGAFVSALFTSAHHENLPEYFQEEEKIRGIVTTSSYEARAFGIKTGMSLREAKKRCPNLIVIKPNHAWYQKLSKELREYLQERIPLIEQFSIDEFFGDVSGWVKDDAIEQFFKDLQDDILKTLGLPCSIGIANSKWIAKLATEYAKPYGLRWVKDIDTFIQEIPIEEFPGIGKSVCKKLHAYKKYTLGDIKSSKTLLYSWGNQGKSLYDRVSGIDNEDINTHTQRKSVGISRTFDPINDREEIIRRVFILSRHVTFMVSRLDLIPSTFSLTIGYEYGKKQKQQQFHRIFNEHFLTKECVLMFKELDQHSQNKIIRLGISLSNFVPKERLTPSVLDIQADIKYNKLMKSNMELRKKYGVDILRSAKEL